MEMRYLYLIDFTSNEESESRREPLFQQRRDFTRRIYLTPERGHSEIILDTSSSDGLPLPRVQRRDTNQIYSRIDSFGQLLPIRSLPNPLRHDLTRRDPRTFQRLTHLVFLHIVIFRHVSDRTIFHVGRRALIESLNSDGKVRSEGLEVSRDVGTGEIDGRWVVGFEREGVVFSYSIVFY